MGNPPSTTLRSTIRHSSPLPPLFGAAINSAKFVGGAADSVRRWTATDEKPPPAAFPTLTPKFHKSISHFLLVFLLMLNQREGTIFVHHFLHFNQFYFKDFKNQKLG